MIGLLLLIPILALLLLDYFVADEYRMIAQKKGYCGRKYFWWSFFLGFVGYLMVVALPERNRPWGEKTPECPATATQESTPPCRRNEYC